MGLFDSRKNGGLPFDVQSAVEKVQEKINGTSQQSGKTKSNGFVPNETTGKATFCSNCGVKLNDGAKFCHGCGAAVGSVIPSDTHISNSSSQTEIPQENYSERRQEYAGKILKCPNCGSPITETTAICPDCGLHITGRSAVSSVQAFKEQLMAIESSRKRVSGGVLGAYLTADKADIQKLALIKNFPIPNSVDDILEFLMLAIANIDVSLSKKTVMNRMNSTQPTETGATIGRTISNAWVSKMEQVYKKAEIIFPNEPAFADIQRLYFEKMKELKIKLK